MQQQKHSKQRQAHPAQWGVLWLGAVLALLALVAGGWWYARAAGLFDGQPAVETTAEAHYQTTTVRRGALARSVSGSGTLVAGQTVDLGFAVSGVIVDLAVQVGDTVQAGQELARLEDIERLELAVQNQALAVRSAEQALAEIQASPALALAEAEAERAAAQIAYDEAAAGLHRPGDPRCLSAKSEEYYLAWLAAKSRAEVWENELDNPNTGYGLDYILEKLNPIRKERDQAYINMTYCQGYTPQEIEASQAALQLAQARLQTAEQQLQRLDAGGGIDLQAQEIAQAVLKTARLQLEKAEYDLAGAVIVAPMAGTVMAVNGSAGQAAGTGALITLADLEQPRLRVTIDETDLADFAAGCQASATFESLSGQSFSGVVSAVTPVLTTSREVAVAEGWVDLNEKRAVNGQPLRPGLAAMVTITCQQAQNALLIPAQTLYQPVDAQPYVYILDAQGQPEKREVEVGLQTVATVEIRAGLREGERVITTLVQEN